MTTIVYKDLELAADSQQQINNEIVAPTNKIHVPEKGEMWFVDGHRVLAMGVAGESRLTPYVKNLLRENFNELSDITRFSTPTTCSGFIVTLLVLENGLSIKMDLNLNADTTEAYIRCQSPIAYNSIGSGTPYARAGMAIGMSAEEAVKLASKVDTNTNDTVSVWKHPGVPKKLTQWIDPTPSGVLPATAPIQH